MYNEKVMDHFMHPRNVGEMEDPSGVGQVGNPKCGDIMKMYIKVDDNENISDVSFQTFGCGAAIATSSMATELIKGKSVNEAMQLTNEAVVEALEGLPPVKLHCSVLAQEAVEAAIGRAVITAAAPSRTPHAKALQLMAVITPSHRFQT